MILWARRVHHRPAASAAAAANPRATGSWELGAAGKGAVGFWGSKDGIVTGKPLSTFGGSVLHKESEMAIRPAEGDHG